MAAKPTQEEDEASLAMARLLFAQQLSGLQQQQAASQDPQRFQEDCKFEAPRSMEIDEQQPQQEQQQQQQQQASVENAPSVSPPPEMMSPSSLALGFSRAAQQLPGSTTILEAELARPLAFRLASPPPPAQAPLATPVCSRGHVYSPPLATHEEVVRDPALFMETLCKFHESMGSRMTSPRMGGNQLDLYRLYQEVTSRGGLEQVIKDRLWKDIKAVFNFPRTTTSASFVLRKYYTSLLHHYEQVYFFRVQGPLVPPPAPLPTPSPVLCSPENGAHSEDPDELGPRTQKRRLHAPPPDMDPAANIGKLVTGSIEEKFEHGYLVTVVIGSEKFRGVLYHVPVGSTPQFASTLPNTTRALVSEPPGDVSLGSVRIRRRRRRLGIRRKDPNAPKLNRSGYNYFFAEQRAKLKYIYPDKDREISKMIGEAWSSMNEVQKRPYQERGMSDKERYKREMRDYKEKLSGITKVEQTEGEKQFVSAPGSDSTGAAAAAALAQALSTADETLSAPGSLAEVQAQAMISTGGDEQQQQ